MHSCTCFLQSANHRLLITIVQQSRISIKWRTTLQETQEVSLEIVESMENTLAQYVYDSQQKQQELLKLKAKAYNIHDTGQQQSAKLGKLAKEREHLQHLANADVAALKAELVRVTAEYNCSYSAISISQVLQMLSLFSKLAQLCRLLLSYVIYVVSLRLKLQQSLCML